VPSVARGIKKFHFLANFTPGVLSVSLKKTKQQVWSSEHKSKSEEHYYTDPNYWNKKIRFFFNVLSLKINPKPGNLKITIICFFPL